MIYYDRHVVFTGKLPNNLRNLIAYYLTKSEDELLYVVKIPVYVRGNKNHYIELEY